MNTTGETKMHAELLPIEKMIKKTLDRRSFDRIQMQMPFDESSIIFLGSNMREHSSFWTNCLIELVNHDIEKFHGKNFYPKVKNLSKTFKDGLVKLPDRLNYTGTLGRAVVPTACCLRVIYGNAHSEMDIDKHLNGDVHLNELVDSFRETDEGRTYRDADPELAAFFTQLEWICPTVPRGSIVVWHGFHTTKGDKNSIAPKATMFLDYTEKDVLTHKLRTHYVDLIRSQPFDPGSGNLNGRSSRPTIEFNAAKGISQAINLPQTAIVDGPQADTMMGKLYVTWESILRQGYGVITPIVNTNDRASEEAPAHYKTQTGRFPWYMTQKELDTIHDDHLQCKKEFESFLTYFVFEREMRFLTCWLLRHGGGEYNDLNDLWETMKVNTELFDSDTREFRWNIDTIFEKHSKPKDVKHLQEKYNQKKTKDQRTRKIEREQYIVENMSTEEIIQFHYNSWYMLFTNARILDVSARKGNPSWETQSKCWFGMFGGNYEGKSWLAGKAAAEIFNDNYFMYWRENMGAQGPKSKEPNKGDPAMCVGHSLQDLNDFIEKKVRDGLAAHVHKRCGQGGGKIIAGDSGMGGGTTYMAGKSHLKLQTGKFGATLAHAFYKNPLVVLERFRVKTHASWGAGHVDHDVQSRIKHIEFGSANMALFKQFVQLNENF